MTNTEQYYNLQATSNTVLEVPEKAPLVDFEKLQDCQNNVIDKAEPRCFCFLCMM